YFHRPLFAASASPSRYQAIISDLVSSRSPQQAAEQGVFLLALGFVRSPLGERVMLMPIETVRGVVGG
ncbi:MAG: hypothetical protein ACKPB8_19895, partial [Alphaproteobacteria bacterium]